MRICVGLFMLHLTFIKLICLSVFSVQLGFMLLTFFFSTRYVTAVKVISIAKKNSWVQNRGVLSFLSATQKFVPGVWKVLCT